MKVTKKILFEMIEDVMDEAKASPEDIAAFEEYNNEVREEMAAKHTSDIITFLKGWHKAADIDEQIRRTWQDNYEGRKGDYSGKRMGTDEFFQKYYVGKSMKLEFLAGFKWAKIGRFTKKHSGVIDTIRIAVTDLVEKRFPEVGQLAKWSYNAMNKEVSRTYGRHQKVPYVRVRMAVGDLVSSIIHQDEREEQMLENLKSQIKLALELKDNKFEYEGKPPVDWRGWTPRER